MSNSFFFFLRNKKNIKYNESENDHDMVRNLKKEMQGKGKKKKEKSKRKSALFVNSNNALNNFCNDKLEIKIKRNTTKLPCIGKYINNKKIKSFYFSSDNLKFLNGMKKSEWMHCISLYKDYKKEFDRKESEMMNELIERKMNRGIFKKKKSYKIGKNRSMPDIFKKLNLIQNEVKIEYCNFVVKNDKHYSKLSFIEIEKISFLKNCKILGIIEGKGSESLLFSIQYKKILEEIFSEKEFTGGFLSYNDVYKRYTENNYNTIHKILLLSTRRMKENGFNITESGIIISLFILIATKVITVNVGNFLTFQVKKEKLNENELISIKKISGCYDTKEIIEPDKVEDSGIIFNQNLIDFSRVLGYENLRQIGITNTPNISEYDVVPNSYLLCGSKKIWKKYRMRIFAKIINECEENNDNIIKTTQIVKELVIETKNSLKIKNELGLLLIKFN